MSVADRFPHGLEHLEVGHLDASPKIVDAADRRC